MSIICILSFILLQLICPIVRINGDPTATTTEGEAPILDFVSEKSGYIGTILEQNVLVDLKPHLEIKNIDRINGVCSYHVFKPNTEEFPFTIDIKDKKTGEAVIVALRNDNKTPLDCNKRKEYVFLIQAHDCSTPSLASAKIPVKIEVIDHDDSKLEFEKQDYKKTLTKSKDIYQHFLTVRAKDNDCTNNGNACSYQIISDDDLLPFKINDAGQITTTGPLERTGSFDFSIRAFDCVSKASFVETTVHIDVEEPCIPTWIDYQTKLRSINEYTAPFNGISLTACDRIRQDNDYLSDSTCQIDSVNSVVKLSLGDEIKNVCTEKCKKNQITPKMSEKIVIFNADATKNDDDDILDDDEEDDEEDYSDEDDNNIIDRPPSDDIFLQRQKRREDDEPLSYRTFNRKIENAQKFNGFDFDGQLSDTFTLNTWIRRPIQADANIKEHIFCGTDSSSMNRHHFGVYFYKGNIKLLLRREAKTSDTHSVFYPSLWEWKLSHSLLNDQKWHFYQIKFNYPNASLIIDGVKFVEDNTNNDIIDAYELKNMNDLTGKITTYIGACYHARANILTDHFEGDIASIVLVKGDSSNNIIKNNPFDCRMECREVLEMNLIGSENYIQSIENSRHDEISVQTNSVYDMTQILRKINYVNKNQQQQQQGRRDLKLSTSIHCSNNDKTIQLNDVTMKVDVVRSRQEYNVQLDGDTQIYASRKDLESGIEVFRDFAIYKIEINRIDENNNKNNDMNFELEQEQKLTKLSQCIVKIEPKRNLMMPKENYEKLMFLQNLLDEFDLKFEETLDQVIISGVQTTDNYERFIRRLSYVITNIPENHETFKLNKRFYLSCIRAEPNIETNNIMIKLNVTGEQKMDYVAKKQMSQFFASDDNDDVVLRERSGGKRITKQSSAMSPMIVGLIAMCICAVAFVLLFATVRLNRAGFFGGGKRSRGGHVVNEENPEQMEWDDSGLNITENPLEMMNKVNGVANYNSDDYEGDEYPTTEDDDDVEDCDDDEDCDEEECDSNEEGDYTYDEDDDQYLTEPEKLSTVDRNDLEWDDSSLELKIKDKHSNKRNKPSRSMSAQLNQFL